MSDNIHLVYSRRPDSVTEEDYNAWYDAHLDELLVVPGLISARRYALSREVVDPQTKTVFTHLSLYEMDGEVADVMRALDEENESGRMQLPDWFDQIVFSSWNAVPLGIKVHEPEGSR